MNTGKKLTSESNKSDESSSEKRIASESQKADQETSGKTLTAEYPTEGARKKIPGLETHPIESPIEKELQVTGNTVKDRIHNSTLAGGLKKVPANFDDNDGDWIVVKSKNHFDRLYLDYFEYQNITPEMVERNYKILNKFWEEKIHLMHSGANKVKIIRKYAGKDGSDKTIMNYKDLLKEAYKLLSQPNGIQTTFFQIEEQRRQDAREKIEPHILAAIEDNVLEPTEERMIKNFARQETELTEEEIDELINEYLKKYKSIRGKGGGGVPESERLFFYQIRKKLNKKLLSKSDEEDLLTDSEEYNISPKRYEELTLKALREIDDSEREKTFEQDKKDFEDFYYSLLTYFSLAEDERLPEPAREKLTLRDLSDTDFFPLSQKTRQKLVEETTLTYKDNLVTEKNLFYENALQNLNQYDGHIEAKQEMLGDPQYLLLLPDMRKELTANTIEEIIQKQSDNFIEISKKYLQLKHWILSDHEKEDFIIIPEKAQIATASRFDWLEKDKRTSLFGVAWDWAQKQHETEIIMIREQVANELKKHIYGLPIHLQYEIEKDTSYFLDFSERRELIISLEEPLRIKAQQKLIELIQNALVFDTLIPQVEKNILEKGEKELLLTNEKNEMSFTVKTAVETISEYCNSFEEVLSQQVSALTDLRKLDDQLVEGYNLSHIAYITQKEVDEFVQGYKPANKIEKETVSETFTFYANNSDLYIVPHDAKQEFDEVLEKAMEKSSRNYKLRLKRWLTNTFEDNMMKVGAAYGVDQNTVKANIDQIRNNYPSWTQPRWLRFAMWFLIITGVFMGLRALILASGYFDWLFLSEPAPWPVMHELFRNIDYDDIVFQVQNQKLWLYAYAISAVLIILIKIFKPAKKKRIKR